MSMFVIVIISLAVGLVFVGLGKLADEVLYGVVLGVIGALSTGIMLFAINLGYSHPRDITCYVENKDRTSHNGSSDARVYTKDCGVLNVQDLFWAGEFNSADRYSAIEVGHKYRFHVTGVRFGFFSMFPHIRTVDKVS